MPNPLCHFELMTKDPAACKEFYSQVFDWKFDDASMPGYTLVNTGGDPGGGIFPKPQDVPSGCMNIYFQVHNLDETLRKAQQLGAKIIVPKMNVPNVGDIAIFADPEGIAIGLFHPLSM